MNETSCRDKTIFEKCAERYLEIPPSKARMRVCRVPGHRRKVGAEGRGIT
jgi:hypothetical protein